MASLFKKLLRWDQAVISAITHWQPAGQAIVLLLIALALQHLWHQAHPRVRALVRTVRERVEVPIEIFRDVPQWRERIVEKIVYRETPPEIVKVVEYRDAPPPTVRLLRARLDQDFGTVIVMVGIRAYTFRFPIAARGATVITANGIDTIDVASLDPQPLRVQQRRWGFGPVIIGGWNMANHAEIGVDWLYTNRWNLRFGTVLSTNGDRSDVGGTVGVALFPHRLNLQPAVGWYWPDNSVRLSLHVPLVTW